MTNQETSRLLLPHIKNALELHYAADEVIDFDYNEKLENRNTANSNVQKLNDEASEIKKRNT